MTITGRTIGEVYGPAMKITDQAEANAYFVALVARHLEQRPQDSVTEAERVQRINLGYYAGYFDHETRLRVERLFSCCHPIFGPATFEPLDPHKAFQMGLEAGRRIRANKGAP